MKTYLDCIPCFLRQSVEAVRNVTDDVRAQEQVVRDMLRMMVDLDLDRPPPVVGQAIHRKLRELTGAADPYRAAKSRFNRLAMDALPELSAIVRQAPDPLLAAAKCAVAANAIDMGVVGGLSDADVIAALRAWPEEFGLQGWEGFRAEVARASDILYLADNAGELAVDWLLIEQIGPARVTLAVRGGPVLNDATLDDAREVGMHELVEVIDNGSDAPGTILSDCSDAFRQRFDRADLVIAKGQGNFETLSGVAGNIFFLFKVKCPLVCRSVGLPLGTHALIHQNSRSAPPRRERR
jgi:damage-control phosphatase, subfamily I